MAEMETKHTATKNKGCKRMNKKSTKVDLTPMVDLGFLLITFFVFTTTMAQPKAMGIIYPKDSNNPSPLCESCVLTVIPAADNKLYYYEGMLAVNTVLKTTSFDATGFRDLLLTKKEAVKSIRGNAEELSLIIRPADESTYKNFVDVLDEINITGVKRYFIDDITAEEKQLLDPDN
jgi:biopolymer transport protein ExbD